MRERKRKQIENTVFLILITGIAMLTRLPLFPFESCDYYQFLRDWYAALQSNGGFAAVGMSIGDYMPTYLYLLAGMTYLPLSDLAGIKLVSCIADFLLAYFVRKIVNLHFGKDAYGTAAYAVILFLPSVVLNSAAWGQCDAIFTAALAATVYFLMTGKEACAVTAFAVSFVFKLQAVFLAPFLFLLFLKRQIRLRTFAIIPLVYGLSILPAALCGRNLWELLTVYISLSGKYKMVSMYLPNLYTWFPEHTPEYIGTAGVFFAGGLVLLSLFCLYKGQFAFTDEILLTLALFYALFVPFVLPHMHERYYYPADILSVAYGFYFPEKFYVPVLTVLSSTYVVCHNLFQTDFLSVQFLSLVMLFVVVAVARHLYLQIKAEEPGRFYVQV
ncbi:hypothetical protein [Caproiciproducens galactitolivorans]|uniref:hypothetical protein n=1 Tax=Caproiciproducens galactitolivorans TaxID=642589 RepID=UPI00240A764F|nr:hypothetical protein [Caproiciproducens galactitolivorans]